LCVVFGNNLSVFYLFLQVMSCRSSKVRPDPQKNRCLIWVSSLIAATGHKQFLTSCLTLSRWETMKNHK